MNMTTNTCPDWIEPRLISSFLAADRAAEEPVLHVQAGQQGNVALADLGRVQEEEAEQLLSEAELLHFRSLRHPRRRREWLGGRVAAKAALLAPIESADFGRQARQLSILPDELGRPRLGGGMSVSISHSGGHAVAFAVQGQSCGIDLQEITTRIAPLASQFATPSEQKLLEQQLLFGSREAGLTMLWAAKEALKKSVLSDQPGFLSKIIAERVSAVQDNVWHFDCSVQGRPSQTARIYGFASCILALTRPNCHA